MGGESVNLGQPSSHPSVNLKNVHDLKVESYVLLEEVFRMSSSEAASELTLRELLRGGEGRSQIIQKFYNKGQVAECQEILVE